MTVRDGPLLDPRSREDIFEEMRQALAKKGIVVNGSEGAMDALSALTWLYSRMLYGTLERINLLPEKHRRNFLNVVHTPSDMAWAAAGIVVFEVAPGYGKPVYVPEDTRILAATDDGSIPFRTVEKLTVAPSSITEVYRLDGASARYSFYHNPRELLLSGGESKAAHAVEMELANLFSWEKEVMAWIGGRLDVEPLDMTVFCEDKIFLWSFRPLTEDDGETEDMAAQEFTPVSLRADGEGRVWLCLPERIPGPSGICLRMELVDPKYAGLELGELSFAVPKAQVLPDTVLSGLRQLDAGCFHPFGVPLKAFEECAIFCDRVFSQAGASVRINFSLSFEIWEEWLPEQVEIVDFKWIMRRPAPKPEEKVYEAFARSVRWEYWNGTAYCALPLAPDILRDFDGPPGEMELCFICPADWQPDSYYGRDGYYLRLSCGECQDLYRLPRRVHTPVISGLQLTVYYLEHFYPITVTTENYGVREPLALPDKLVYTPAFRPLGKPESLLLGFDSLSPGCGLSLHFEMKWKYAQENIPQTVSAELFGKSGCGSLMVSDQTNGFAYSGSVVISIPDNAAPMELFGKSRYWISLYAPQAPLRLLRGVYLNACKVENCIREEESFAYTNMIDGQKLRLRHGNIVWIAVKVRSVISGEMELWSEYEPSQGKYAGACYLLDSREGEISFPDDFTVIGLAAGSGDIVRVEYDYTDGDKANLPAGAINRMEDEIPFIQSVYNPMPVLNGANGETYEEKALRKAHALYSGGGLVTKADCEFAATDICPLVHSARCLPGNPARLAILLKTSNQRESFADIARRLSRQLGKMKAFGDIRVIPVLDVEYVCGLRIKRQRLWESYAKELLKDLAAFLDPVTGGLSGKGWTIGVLPTLEQVRRFIYQHEPQIPVTEIEISLICEGKAYSSPESIPSVSLCVPGAVRASVAWEDEKTQWKTASF